MDTNNYGKIPECGSLNDLTGKKVVVGAKQLKKALIKGHARYIFLAENADPAVTDPIEDLSRQSQVPVTWVSTMSELGRACGIEVGAAAAAIID